MNGCTLDLKKLGVVDLVCLLEPKFCFAKLFGVFFRRLLLRQLMRRSLDGSRRLAEVLFVDAEPCAYYLWKKLVYCLVRNNSDISYM